MDGWADEGGRPFESVLFRFSDVLFMLLWVVICFCFFVDVLRDFEVGGDCG